MKSSKIKYIAAAITASMLISSVSLCAYALSDSTSAEENDPEVEIVEEAEEEEDTELENPEEDEENVDVILEDDTEEPDEIITGAPVETAAPETEAAPATTLPEATYDPISEMTLYADQSINVRLGPGTNYGIFGGLASGESVKVIGKSGDWYAVSFLGGTGYIRSDLLTATAPAATTAAPQTTAAPVTEAVPEETTTQAVAEVIEPDDVTTEPPVTESAAPEETNAPETEAAVSEAPAETTAAPAETDSEDTEDKAAGTAAVSGPMALLIALGGAVIVFFLVGLLPIIIHSVHHKKLYQY